jgi:hypothetical protein
VRFHQAPRDIQAQAKASSGVSGRVNTIEAIEYPREMLSRNPVPFIPHGYDGFFTTRSDSNQDVAAVGAVFDGIVEQVRQHLTHARPIPYSFNPSRCLELDPMDGRLGERLVHARARFGNEVYAIRLQVHVVNPDPGCVHKVVDQPIQDVSLLDDGVDGSFVSLAGVLEKLSVTLDCSDRIAELMGHRRKQLALHSFHHAPV